MVRLFCLLVLLGLGGLTPAPSAAQHEVAQEANREAREAFELGRNAFAAGEYDDALTHFERSYELSHAPDLLYNIGHIAERLRLDERALAAFERYLEARPETEARESIEARMQLLRASIARREQTAARELAAAREPSAVGPATVDARRDAQEPSLAGWIVWGGGVAVAVGGAALLGLGAVRADEVSHTLPGTPWADVRDAYADADSFTISGAVLLGVGGAAAAVGAALLTAGAGSGSGSGPAEIAVGPGGVELRGRF